MLYPSRSSPGAVPIATGGIAAAELLFDAAAIDPDVVAAADFSSSEQLGDIFRFGAFAEHVAAMSEAAQAGAKSALRGYVGEMMVASRLAGHEVSLPETPNNAGYDLLVDGHPFQVKCYGSSDGALDALGEHFDKHPDIPVYVNSEVMPAVQRSGEPWAGQVFTVEGYDYETTNRVMEESLAAGSDLAALDVPIFAVAVSAARNLHGWWKGSVPLHHLPWEVIIDGSVHGGLSVAGGFTGAALGGLVFGPAGAVVFGGVGGIAALFGAGVTGRAVRRLFYRKSRELVRERAALFENALEKAMKEKDARKRRKIDQLDAAIARKREDLDRQWAARYPTEPELEDPPKPVGFWTGIWNWFWGPEPKKRPKPPPAPPPRPESPNEVVARWMRLKFEDQILCVAESRVAMAELPKDPFERSGDLMRLMREAGVHPLSVYDELENLCNALKEHPR